MENEKADFSVYLKKECIEDIEKFLAILNKDYKRGKKFKMKKDILKLIQDVLAC